MAARKRRGTSEQGWTENVRERIKASMLLNALTDHVLGDREMAATQVSAANILLRKVLPDLASTDLTTKGEKLGPALIIERTSDDHPAPAPKAGNGARLNGH